MIQGRSVLAIIPARGGSKRLPNKNTRCLNGKPLIAYSIEAALTSKYVDAVVVSTDSGEIRRIAEAAGAEAPFLRPDELASDTSGTLPVVAHAIEYYRQSLQKTFDIVLLLQPTSPLRTTVDIDCAAELFMTKSADAVISVCPAEHSPLWCNTLPDDLSLTGFLPNSVLNRRSQDLPTYYRINGAIYLCVVERLLKEQTFFICNNAYAYIMEQERSIDIDTLLDFQYCELLLSQGR